MSNNIQKVTFTLDQNLPFLNTIATKGFFYLQYPSGWTYWAIQDDNDIILKEGNYTFLESTLNQWTTSDDVLITKIKEDQPWNVIYTPTPTAPVM